jgi:pyruvate kinase
MPKPLRQTKIIFTIGPATADESVLKQLILTGGVDVCRINMAHATHEWTRTIMRKIRKVCSEIGREIALMMDVKGPEIRTGDIPETWLLEKGELLDFVTRNYIPSESETCRNVKVNYEGLPRLVKTGDTLLVDSGLIRFTVISKTETSIRCRVETPGPLGCRRHINLPGIKIDLPALSEKDIGDIDVGIEEGIDIIALSFAREGKDIKELRDHLDSRNSKAWIIAKIEDQSAVAHLEDIIQASDGLMVARGDLGIEVPYEQLPIIQRRAVNACLRLGKPVIVATHMLESMIHVPMPTRAEISDIANAVFEQADCVMLSGETTVGKYPLDCVDVLNRVISSIELQPGKPQNDTLQYSSTKVKLLRSAVVLSHELDNSCIVVFTRYGYMAQMLSSLRPRKCPIYAFTDDPMVFRQMLILWGVEPFLLDFNKDPEITIRKAFSLLKKKDWVQRGDEFVVITNALAKDRIIDAIQIRKLD